MTYTIVNTAGTTVATVNEAQLNSNFDVTLIGKNYTNYGQIFNDNMYRLLENFAAPNSGLLSPVQGQLWYNTTTNTLNLYNGTTWNSFAGAALSVKGTKVGINNSDPEFDMDITSTLRSKGAAWINYAGANNSDANQAGLVLGTVGKGVLPTNNAGTIGIWSSEGATSRLQAMLSLKTDPTAANRRLAIGVIEQGTSWRNITLAEQGGSVGIGTVSIGYKLDVQGGRAVVSPASEAFAVGLRYNATTNGVWLGSPSDHAFQISSFSGTPYLNIDASGNVGIGTISPTTKLSIVSATNGGINVNDGTVNTILYNTNNLNGSIGTTTNHPMALYTNNTEKVHIATHGSVGINQTNPAAHAKLDIKTANHTIEGMRIISDGNQWIQLHASLDAGNYNPSVLAGDSAIIYSAGTINTGRLVIAPWGTTKSGVVLDSTGKFTTSTSSVIAFTGVDRGAFAVNDINSTINQWTALDFSNPTVNEIPLARVASYYTSGGTYLSLGTSNNYASGITNRALTITPSGDIEIRTGTSGDIIAHVFTYNENGGEYQIRDSDGNVGTLFDFYNVNNAKVSRLLQMGSTGSLQIGLANPSNTTGSIQFYMAGLGHNVGIIDSLGNWGIGTDNPSGYNAKLAVSGTHATQSFRVDESTSGYQYTQGLDDVGVYYKHNSTIHGYRWLLNNTTEAMRITAVADVNIANNVGIGRQAVNVSGFTTLSIDSPVNGGLIELFRQGTLVGVLSAFANNLNLSAVGAGQGLALGVNNTTKLFIDSFGSIFTDNAAGGAKGNGTINAKGLYIDGVAVTAGTGAGYTPTYPVSSGQTWTYADPGGQSTYFWGTNDGNLMRPYQTATLSVAYATNATNATNAANATNASYATRAGIANSTEPSANFQMNSLGVGCGPAGTTGTIYTTNNIVAFYSDQRLKKNIELIINPLDKVLSLRGVTYTQNELAEQYGYTNYESQVGVIAQDVQAVLPEAVKLAPFDTDTDGSSKSGENYMTVQYEKIVPLLIEAIKELTAKVAVLEEKLK